MRRSGGQVVGLFDNCWKGSFRQIFLVVCFFDCFGGKNIMPRGCLAGAVLISRGDSDLGRPMFLEECMALIRKSSRRG